ncbi:hypothetical protein GUJ93_ZPchr0001g32302 [Zizania palustris]|uniref:Uncharacterized protein n=1 Tax=Zizania palustris TaxID=103762 RepID=A0A8J5S2X2_ZIZPA|nr:hypothetical protein GUJ93_ZPchr0001g32302 [Zizania palustris]
MTVGYCYFLALSMNVPRDKQDTSGTNGFLIVCWKVAKGDGSARRKVFMLLEFLSHRVNSWKLWRNCLTKLAKWLPCARFRRF